MHHLLREPQVARRGTMRPLVRLRRLLGPDEGVPGLPRSYADVDARYVWRDEFERELHATLLGLMS